MELPSCLPRRRRCPSVGAITLVALSFMIGACGSSAPVDAADESDASSLAFVDESATVTSSTLIAAAPDVALSDVDAAFVRFEATWVCEVQRRTFPTEDGREIALLERLADTGLDEAEYRAFRARVNDEQDLRDSILFSYQETCRP